jgi:hypothetical protein
MPTIEAQHYLLAFLRHRACAAFFAMNFRFRADSDAARA